MYFGRFSRVISMGKLGFGEDFFLLRSDFILGHPVHIVPSPVNRGSCFMLPRRQHCPEKSIIYLWRYATLFLSNIHTFFSGYAFSFRYVTLFPSDKHTFFSIVLRKASSIFEDMPHFFFPIYIPFFQDMLFLSDMSHFFLQINILFSALFWEKHHLSFKICHTFSSNYIWWSLYNQSLLKLSENNVGYKEKHNRQLKSS